MLKVCLIKRFNRLKMCRTAEPAAKKKNWVGTDPTVSDLGFSHGYSHQQEKFENVEMSEPC
jgi:hypothetical protein